MASRMIADPLRLFDCCQESDGAVAVVMTSVERARDRPNAPAIVRASAQSAYRGMTPLMNFYRSDVTPYDEIRLLGEQLYDQGRLTSNDVQVCNYIRPLWTVGPTSP